MPFVFLMFSCTASRKPRRSYRSPALAAETVPRGSVIRSEDNPSFPPTEFPFLAAARHNANQTSTAGARLRTRDESDVHPF
jgi:hypothetical protein